MSAPEVTVTFDPPLASDSGTVFDSKAFALVGSLNDWSAEVNTIGDYVELKADETLASAIAGNLSSVDLSVSAGYLIGVNEAGNALESVSIDEIPLATQAQAEAGTDNSSYMTPLRTAEAVPAIMNASGSAPIYACRAWVNFDGTGTVAIRASGNVSSITDDGAGLYTLNFTTAMPDVNYSVAGSGGDSTNVLIVATSTLATGSCGIRLTNTAGAGDNPQISVAVFR